MMKNRTFQTVAENQVLMMRGLSQLLLTLHREGQVRNVHTEKLATKLACRADDLEELVEAGVFAIEPKAEATR